MKLVLRPVVFKAPPCRVVAIVVVQFGDKFTERVSREIGNGIADMINKIALAKVCDHLNGLVVMFVLS